MVAENRFCTPPAPECGDRVIIKFYEDPTGQWFEICRESKGKGIPRDVPLGFSTSMLQTEIHDCKNCKHDFACMVQVGCNRWFESK